MPSQKCILPVKEASLMQQPVYYFYSTDVFLLEAKSSSLKTLCAA